MKRLILILWIIITPIVSHAEVDGAKKDYVIAIDIGHTRNNAGATSARGVGEFYFNQNIARLLLEKLLASGFNSAFIINESGNDIALKERTQQAYEKNSQLFISIHHDSAQEKYLSTWQYKGEKYFYTEKFSGYSMFISKDNSLYKDSLAFSTLLGEKLLSHKFTPTLHHAEKIKGENRELLDKKHGIYNFPELAVLRTAKMPAILFECGVILNRNEEILLSNPVYQDTLVSVIVSAIEDFYQR